MIATETATVETVERTFDDLGEPTGSSATSEEVAVLVAPGSTADLDASRPNGAQVALTLHFPKTWSGVSLKGAHVTVRGRRYRVVGDPQPYTAANTPGRFNMPVEVEAVDG